MGKKEAEMKAKIGIETAIEHLENLLSGLKKGAIYVKQGSDVMQLNPSKSVKLEVEAKSKKGREKISIQLSWKLDEAGDPGDGKSVMDDAEENFSISSAAPAPEKTKQ
jgi:amphi-Trp domain-containing protein